jgi:hypothetical protein
MSTEDRRTEATKRQEALAKELKIDTYARFPRELIESMMDMPPKEPKPGGKNYEKAYEEWEKTMRTWKPVRESKERVYWAWVRHSWCWPICLAYAVVTDDRDEIKLSPQRPHHYVLFSEQAVAEELGLTQQRVNTLTLTLVDEKRLRVEVPAGRKYGLAVFPDPRAAFTEEELRKFHKSTLVISGIDGPPLDRAVMHRFSSLINELGEDGDRIIEFPAEEEGKPPQIMSVFDYRTLVWQRVIDNRTAFLKALKESRYSERKTYTDIATQVRQICTLISQTQSSDNPLIAAATSLGTPSAAAKSPSGERKAPPTQPTVASAAQAPEMEPAGATTRRIPKAAERQSSGMERAGEVLQRIPNPAADRELDELAHLQQILTDWLITPVPPESAVVLLKACRARMPLVTAEEVLTQCAVVIEQKGGLTSRRWKSIDSPMGLFVTIVPGLCASAKGKP